MGDLLFIFSKDISYGTFVKNNPIYVTVVNQIQRMIPI